MVRTLLGSLQHSPNSFAGLMQILCQLPFPLKKSEYQPVFIIIIVVVVIISAKVNAVN